MKKRRNLILLASVLSLSLYTSTIYNLGYNKASLEGEKALVQFIDEQSNDLKQIRRDYNQIILGLIDGIIEQKRENTEKQAKISKLLDLNDYLANKLDDVYHTISGMAKAIRKESGNTVSKKYSMELAEYVWEVNYDYAEKYGFEFNPNLTLAFMKVESNYTSDANSYADAKGIMQLMDSTGRAYAKILGYNTYDPYDWKQNIRVGWYYYNSMKEDYGEYKAIVAYNHGLRDLSGALNKSMSNSKSYLNLILSAETRIKNY
jgi:hypothetical protein